MSTGIKETGEILDALKALAVRTAKSLQDDGKISWIEGVTFLVEFSKVKDAVVGAKQVPDELKDLTDDELEQIREQVRVALKEVGVKNDISVITDAAILWIKQSADFVRICVDPPKEAEQA